MAKNSSIRLFHFSSLLANGVHDWNFPFLSTTSSGKMACIATRKLLLQEFCGCPILRGQWIQTPSHFLGILLSFDLMTFPTDLHVHLIIIISTWRMLLSFFLTSLFVIFCSCTWSHFIPRILRIAKWWKEQSFFRFFSVTFHDSQPQRRVLRGPARYNSFLLFSLCPWH